MAGKTKKKSIVRKLIKWLIVLVILAILGALGYYVGLPMLKASVTTTYDVYRNDGNHFKFPELFRQREHCLK